MFTSSTPALTVDDSQSPTSTALRFCRFSLQLLVLALGFFLSLSTTICGALIVVYLAFWLASGDWQFAIANVRSSRVAVAGLVMFALLAAGMSYTIATPDEACRGLFKYRELLYVPPLLSIFADPLVRRRALTAFLAGVGVMLALSYFEFWSGIEIGLVSVSDRIIFKDRIIHCLLVAFFAYVLAHQAVAEPSGWQGWGRWWRIAVIALALVNMFVLVQGRTGQMIATLLLILFVFQYYGWKGCVTGAVCAAMFWGAACMVLKPVQMRLRESLSQLNDRFGPEKKRNKDGRIEFYELSLGIVGNSPLIGLGTGGFHRAYQLVAESRNAPVTTDPHNEYLMLAVQLGLIGPLTFLTMLGIHWQCSREMPDTERYLAQGTIVAIAAGCLVNSLMNGFTGGLFWSYFSAMTIAAAPVSSGATANLPIRSLAPQRQ